MDYMKDFIKRVLSSEKLEMEEVSVTYKYSKKNVLADILNAVWVYYSTRHHGFSFPVLDRELREIVTTVIKSEIRELGFNIDVVDDKFVVYKPKNKPKRAM